MAKDSFTKEAMSSLPAGTDVSAPSACHCRRLRTTGRHNMAPARAGSTSSGVRLSAPEATTAETMSGASAKPMVPPVENQPMARWLPWPAMRATRADSGW